MAKSIYGQIFSQFLFIIEVLLLSATCAHAQTNPANLDADRQVFQNEYASTTGRSIAMYQGLHAAVGHPFDNRVYLFTHDSLSFPWRVRHTFYPDAFSRQFGSSVASTDQFLAIGDWFDDQFFTSSGAVHIYQKTSDGGWRFLQKLKASNPDSVLYFGVGIEMSSDYLAVINGESSSFNKPGGLHIYKFNGAEFALQNEFIGGINSLSPPIDMDNDRIVVGDPFDDTFFNNNGKLKTYKRTGTNWAFEADIFPANPMANMNFGESVTIQDDIILGGIPSDDGNGVDSGKALLFQRIGNNWSQIQELTPDAPGANKRFGLDMDMQNDSLWITDNFNGHLFTSSGGVWDDVWSISNFGGRIEFKGQGHLVSGKQFISKAIKLNSSGTYSSTELSEADDFYCDPNNSCNFGEGVAISDESLIIGSNNAVWMYEKVDTGWRQKSMHHGEGLVVAMDGKRAFFKYFNDDILIADKIGEIWKITSTIKPPANAEQFGDAIAAHNDYLVVGAFASDIVGSNSGSAYIYKKSGTGYIFHQELLPTVSNGLFGNSVDIHNDKLIIGSYFESSARGSASIYSLIGTTWTFDQKVIAIDAEDFDQFGSSVAIHDSTVVIGAQGDKYGSTNNAGSTYVFRKNTPWNFDQKIENTYPGSNDYCGEEVSLSYNNLIVACPGKNDQGIYFFKDDGTQFNLVDSANSINLFHQDIDISNENYIIGNIETAYTGQTTTNCYGHLLVDFFITPGVYSAEYNITAKGFVLPGGVTLSASDAIYFEYPFQTGSGADLETDNSGCQ